MRISDWSSDVCSSDLVGVGQRRGQGRVAFRIAVDVDLLRDHAQDRSVPERAAAEVPAGVDRGGEVVAVGGARMRAHRLAQAQLAVDVEVQLRPAQLAVDPQPGVSVPAGEGAEGGLGLAEVAAGAAEVDAPAAVAGEAAEHHVAAARSEEHTSELQSLMRISYAVFCLKKKKITYTISSSNRSKNQP